LMVLQAEVVRAAAMAARMMSLRMDGHSFEARENGP